MDEEWKNRLRSAIKSMGTTGMAVSLSANQNESAVRNMLKAGTSPKVKSLVGIADALGVSIEWLLYGDEELRDTPIVGHVGAGGSVFNYDDIHESDGLGMAKTPIGLGKLYAVIIKGDSMLPRYSDGDIVAYGAHSPTLDSVDGKECIVRTVKGQMYLKRVRRGTKRKTVTLESYNATIMPDEEVEWIAPIIWRDMS